MRFAFFIGLLLSSFCVQAFTLRADAPARYEVQSGDTLWGIANHYLVHPWEWQALWRANPQIKNPNRLYPGAIIELHYDKARPYLRVLSNGTVKLSPHVRPMPAADPVPAIPLNEIRPFLNDSLVLDRDVLADAPRVISFTTERLTGGQGDNMYVEGLCPKEYKLPPGETYSYAVYRRCETYLEPRTKRFLGYKAKLIAYGELVAGGDPATVVITDIVQAVRLNDRVMPNNHPDFDLSFDPKAPGVGVDGIIIDILSDYSLGAVGLVAVINRGMDAGLQVGDVLGVYGKPRRALNTAYRFDEKPPCIGLCIPIPLERLGEMMVFRTFSHTSFALVVRSIRPMTRLDIVRNP